jgi:uncharacterized protein YecE (DUF72 family)
VAQRQETDVAGRIRTGIAGWVFPEWRKGVFYPEGLPQKDELAYASKALGTIEINSTFYSHQKAASFEAWAAQTPEDFVFPVKGHQGVTHIKRLKDVEPYLANFFASGVLALGKRLGPFVWQLPPNMKFDADRMAGFLALLPHDPDALVALARKHDEKTREPYLDASGIGTVRHAIEVRHASFAEPAFLDMLRTANVALVIADTAEWPTTDATADFIYCRLQGAPGSDHYEDADLDRLAARVKAWADGKPPADAPLLAAPERAPKPRDVFAHFVSTDKQHAPRNAMALAQRLA